MRHSPIPIALALAAAPLAAQETVGTITATMGGEERIFVINESGAEPTSSFRRSDGVIEVDLVARPDRTPSGEGAMMELSFTVTGIGPTAEPSEVSLRYVTDSGETLHTGEGSAEVSLTAFGIEAGALSVSGNFSSQLQRAEAASANEATQGDFQATLRETP